MSARTDTSRAWNTAYREAVRCYARGDIDDWTDDDTIEVADRLAKERPRGSAMVLPAPGRTAVYIGQFLALDLWDPSKRRIIQYRYPKRSAPPLIWSCTRKALYALPGRPIPKPTVSAYTFPAALEAYRGWNQGKYPRGASRYYFPPVRLGRPLVAVAVGYWSDKFGKDGEFREYIHHHERGVMGWVGNGAFFVRGGKLTLTPEGLDH